MHTLTWIHQHVHTHTQTQTHTFFDAWTQLNQFFLFLSLTHTLTPNRTRTLTHTITHTHLYTQRFRDKNTQEWHPPTLCLSLSLPLWLCLKYIQHSNLAAASFGRLYEFSTRYLIHYLDTHLQFHLLWILPCLNYEQTFVVTDQYLRQS